MPFVALMPTGCGFARRIPHSHTAAPLLGASGRSVGVLLVAVLRSTDGIEWERAEVVLGIRERCPSQNPGMTFD